MQLHLEISVVTTGIKAPRYRAECVFWLVGVLQKELKVSKAIIFCLGALGEKEKKKMLPWNGKENSCERKMYEKIIVFKGSCAPHLPFRENLI